MYKRILLKISGEQLSGTNSSGIDTKIAVKLSENIKKALEQTNTQIIIVVGAGNIVRGKNVAGDGVKRVTADHMGMLGTMINALALTDIFESRDIPTRCMSNIFAAQVAEPFNHRLANKHLERGRVVIVAGGIGRPYLTTDTAAVSLALELDCDAVLKATKVDGVYDKDPAKFNNAKKIESLDYQRALSDNEIQVMDKAALGLAMDHKMKVVVFDSFGENNLLNVVKENSVGTVIG
jgi:uridylate kinase